MPSHSELWSTQGTGLHGLLAPCDLMLPNYEWLYHRLAISRRSQLVHKTVLELWDCVLEYWGRETWNCSAPFEKYPIHFQLHPCETSMPARSQCIKIQFIVINKWQKKCAETHFQSFSLLLAASTPVLSIVLQLLQRHSNMKNNDAQWISRGR